MSAFTNLFLSFSVFIPIFFISTNAANFQIRNQCPFPVWAAAVPGGGRRLNTGETWPLTVRAGTTGGRIWARTKCTFDGAGKFHCETGDCGGLLKCQAYGAPPNTLAEYALNQYMNQDFIDISLVDGFNVGMDFSPTGGCARGIKCDADINRQCPAQLKVAGGCNNPCTTYKEPKYCCTNKFPCGPTDLSRFFKDKCKDAYSYPKDDLTSKCLFTCPGGTNYKVVFCP